MLTKIQRAGAWWCFLTCLAGCTVEQVNNEKPSGKGTGGASHGGSPGTDAGPGAGGSSSDGATTNDLTAHVLGFAPLSEPTAKGPTQAPCAAAEGCIVKAAPSGAEFDCGFTLTSETRVAADNLVALGPDPDLWPGDVLKATPAAKGTLDAVPIPLGAMKITSTLVGSPTVDVADPSASAFQQALNQILAGQSAPSGTAVGSNITVESIFSEEDLSKTLGVDLSLVGGSIPASLGLTKRSSTTVTTARVAVSFVQSYFQVSMDPHTNAADYFGAGVTSAELDTALAGNVPVYVRSVTYGRRVVAVFENTNRTDSDQFALEIGGLYSGIQGEASFTKNTTSTVNETRFAAMVLGSSRVITTKDELFAYLDETPDVTTAWPIGYALQYPGSETSFSVGVTTEVVTKTCQQCGASDPYADARNFQSAFELNPTGPISDDDAAGVRLAKKGLLPPGQERWFTVRGSDDAFYIVDPQASLGSPVAGAEVCVFADCESGPTTLACLIGNRTTVGTLEGCCSSGADAQLTGDSSLCPDKISDDARVYVQIRLGAAETACVPFDLSVHY